MVTRADGTPQPPNPFLNPDSGARNVPGGGNAAAASTTTSTSATSPAEDAWYVWVPQARPSGGPVSADHPQATQPGLGQVDGTALYGWAGDLFVNDHGQFNSLAATLDAAGYSNSGTRDSVDRAWRQALKDSSKLSTPEDPWSFLSRLAGKNTDPNGKPGSKPKVNGPDGPTAYTGPTTDIALTNEGDAHVILNNALAQYLGRQATDKELAAFKEKLNATETANPRVTTPTGSVKQDTTRTGGVNQQQEAVDWVKSQDDYAEVTADTTLMGWFMDALQSGSN